MGRSGLLLRLLLLLAAAGLWMPVLPDGTARAEGLRAAIPLGAAINYERLRQDPVEMGTYSDSFGAFTPENVMKMESLQPQDPSRQPTDQLRRQPPVAA